MITSSVLPWNVGLMIIKNIVEDGYWGNTHITSLLFIILNDQNLRYFFNDTILHELPLWNVKSRLRHCGRQCLVR